MRAKAMRDLIILNEFKYNKSFAIKNINNYRKEEFFRWSYNLKNLIYIIRSRNIKEIIKFLCIKCRCYALIKLFYN